MPAITQTEEEFEQLQREKRERLAKIEWTFLDEQMALREKSLQLVRLAARSR